MILQTSSHPIPSCLLLLPLHLSLIFLFPFSFLPLFFLHPFPPSFLPLPSPPPFHHSPSTYPTASWSVHTVWCWQLYQSSGTECTRYRHVRRPATPTHHDQILRHIGHHTNTSTTNFSQFSAAVINSEITAAISVLCSHQASQVLLFVWVPPPWFVAHHHCVLMSHCALYAV